MPGDYTRFTHRPERAYSGVRMQQGRVQLDSDWNEQADILERRLRVQAMDTFGRAAVPEPTTPGAFTLAPLTGTTPDLSIGGGRLYVDGLLAEIFPGEAYTYRHQKHYPAPPDLPSTGDAIAYLDVWDREVTHLEDPDLLEVALGGPDTTTRRQTVWQIKWRAVASAQCGTDVNLLFPSSAGRATTSAIAPPASDDPCILSPTGGYRGLENRLYRVEVHTPGGLNTARFKWSRDNGSIVSRVNSLAVSGTQTVLSVARIGRDAVLRFSVGDWVEVTDDHRELMGEPGEMAQIVDTSESALTITLDRAIPAGAGRAFGATPVVVAARHTRVRKWDQRTPGNTLDANGLIAIDGTSVHLEDGVYVQLTVDAAGGTFAAGDYWVFAARTADASVEPLANAPPRGIEHHYCQLGTLAWQGTPSVLEVNDCRTLWPDPNCCTVSVRPGESIQLAIDSLPSEGGCVCLLPGIHTVDRAILIDARTNVCIEGLGRASKVVTDASVAGTSVFYIAGASRQICLHDFLVFADDRPALVTVAEDARAIRLSGLTLIDSPDASGSCCLLLAGGADVEVTDSTMVGHVGVLQATPEQFPAVATALAALRPAPIPDGDEEDEGEQDEETPVPEMPPLHELAVIGSRLHVLDAGIDLQNAVAGRLHANVVTGFPDPKSLAAWRRAGAANVATVLDLHQLLDGLLAQLTPPLDLEAPPENAVGVRSWLLEGFDIRGNHIAARRGIDVVFARQVEAHANRVTGAQSGLTLAYAFDCAVRGNRLTVAHAALPVGPPSTLAEAVNARAQPGQLAVVTRFARGLEVDANTIDAQSGVGTMRGGLATSHAGPYQQSLLRLLRVGRAWRVVVELSWLLLVIVRALMAVTNSGTPLAPELETKTALDTWLFARLLGMLGNSAFVPTFVGKARITNNTLVVARYGVFLNQILSVGGIGITGNRISGFTCAGIEIRPLFSVGLFDRYAVWVHCAFQWLIALLTLLRDRLTRMLDGEPVVEPTEPTEVNAGTVAVAGVSWLLFFCSRFCHGGQPPGGTEPGVEPESPAQDLKEALDDLLDHVNPAWLEDLVNQSHVIEANTLRGAGDGIVTGIDGTHIRSNHVSVELGSTLPFETLMLGIVLQGRFANTLFSDPLLFQSLLDVDRDMLLLSQGQGTWVDAHVNDAGFRSTLAQSLTEVATISAPDSPVTPRVMALHTALTATTPDLDTAKAEWARLVITIWTALRGHGIVMRGGTMTCADNRVQALRGCAPLVARAAVTRDTTGMIVAPSLLALPGVLPAVPAIGGIWQFTNLMGWMEDFLAVSLPGGSDQTSRYARLIWAMLTYLALASVRDRRLSIARNGVDEALVFGVRTLQAGGGRELDIVDNLISDAVRVGVCHRGFASGQDDDGLHLKVHRNTVSRTTRVFEPPWALTEAAAKNGLVDFAALIWLDNLAGRALVGSNHGDGAKLAGQRCAVHVGASVAGVTDNHVEATAELAFEVNASQGLFSCNLTHPGNSVGTLRQPPNVENL